VVPPGKPEMPSEPTHRPEIPAPAPKPEVPPAPEPQLPPEPASRR
jgi:hypothetical protein